jgi:hypothetical protein
MELEPEVKMELEAAGLITYTSFLKNRFVIIPSFKITKLGNENKFRSQYIVYDKVLKRNLSFYFDEGPDLASYIKKFKFLNPLFKRNFPNLDKLNQNGPNILNRAESEEVEILIDNSLAFNSKNPFDYIQKNDGFINGPLLMRNEILRKYPQGKIGKIKLGDKKFLTIKENKNKNIVETFIPLYLKKGFVFKINYPQDSNFRNDFLSTFLYFSKWENPKFGGEFFLTSKEKDFKSYALERFLICAKEGISDPLYLELVMEGLDSYLFVGNLNEGIKFDKETLNKLNDQKNAIKEKSFVLKGP